MYLSKITKQKKTKENVWKPPLLKIKINSSGIFICNLSLINYDHVIK